MIAIARWTFRIAAAGSFARSAAAERARKLFAPSKSITTSRSGVRRQHGGLGVRLPGAGIAASRVK